MNSEKVKEIKESLQRKINRAEKGKDDFVNCVSVDMLKMYLTYINELESENESCHEVLADLKTIIKQQNDRIAELEKENAELKEHVTEVEKGIINIAKERNKKDELASKFIDSYNDSLKQFAEKLIKRITDNDGKPIASLTVKGIKTILKEEYGIGEDYKKEIFALKTTLEDREHEVRELNKKVERLEQSLSDCAFMTSSIGNLPINSIGLRRAVDEIARLQTVEAELQELNAKYYNEAKDSRRKIKILKEENEKLKSEIINYQQCIENLSMDNTILDSQLKESSEWHYIMYGDLPVEDTDVWCYDGNGYFYCSYRHGDFLTQSADGRWVNVAIVAWTELPKYEES